MSQPPVTSSWSTSETSNTAVRMDMTMRVKMTSANMASVRPVRNLELMG